MKRRTFLKSIGVGTGALLLSTPFTARRALAAVNRSFVLCYFQGGWDTLMSLDPRDPTDFSDARRAETLIELGWDQLPAGYGREVIRPEGSNIAFGPVMAPMAEHHDRMCVLRGMTMDTVAHDVGRRYFATGLPPRGTQAAGSAVGTRIVAQQGDATPFPNLVTGVETYNDGEPSYASGLTVSSVTDLVVALQDGPSAPPAAVRDRLTAYRDASGACDPVRSNRRGLLDLLRSSQQKARELVQSGLADRFAFQNTQDPEMVELSARYQIEDIRGPGAKAAMAFQAVKYELSQCVSISVTESLDTHDATWATDQPDRQAAGWTAVAQLVRDLADTPDPSRGGRLLDHTTVLCFSEFGRTALLNSRGGRDHSLTSSCCLLGAGVPGNTVVGRSSDVGMAPVAIDPSTGEPDDVGLLVTPTHVVASLLASAGYDPSALRTDGLPCLMA